LVADRVFFLHADYQSLLSSVVVTVRSKSPLSELPLPVVRRLVEVCLS
jgi:hypothetical protein